MKSAVPVALASPNQNPTLPQSYLAHLRFRLRQVHWKYQIALHRLTANILSLLQALVVAKQRHYPIRCEICAPRDHLPLRPLQSMYVKMGNPTMRRSLGLYVLANAAKKPIAQRLAWFRKLAAHPCEREDIFIKPMLNYTIVLPTSML